MTNVRRVHESSSLRHQRWPHTGQHFSTHGISIVRFRGDIFSSASSRYSSLASCIVACSVARGVSSVSRFATACCACAGFCMRGLPRSAAFATSHLIGGGVGDCTDMSFACFAAFALRALMCLRRGAHEKCKCLVRLPTTCSSTHRR